MRHSVTVNVEEGGLILAWCFTTLPGKANVEARDIAFSLKFDDNVIRPYERHRKSPSELIKGMYQCPSKCVMTFTWHNEYSLFFAKYLAYKIAVVSPQRFIDTRVCTLYFHTRTVIVYATCVISKS
jgi:hypothetical protein